VIYGPRLGETVRIHYNAKVAKRVRHHGGIGPIVAIGRGPGPMNIAVKIGDEGVVVPRGNLVREKQK
jgi:hypothetical protein